jgi:phosphoribosylglycinamide formyltransferase-1
MEKIKLAILISGRGSNMEAIIRACRNYRYPARIVAVMSDKAAAPGLETAAAAGIPAYHIEHRDRRYFATHLAWNLMSVQADLIVLAGFMRILDAEFVKKWEGRIINIHPSLLPAYPGLHPHEQAIMDDAPISGCTVHYVVPEVDAGPIISQSVVQVHSWDSPGSLAARIIEREHWLYPETIRMIAQKMLRERH